MDDDRIRERSNVQVVIPQLNPVVDLELLFTPDVNHEVVEHAAPSPLSIEQRNQLFFGRSSHEAALSSAILLIPRDFLDELLPVYVVFRTICENAAHIDTLVSRIEARVDISAYGKAPPSGSGFGKVVESSPSRGEDIIWSAKFERSSLRHFKQHDEWQGRQVVCFVWQTAVELSMVHAGESR